ncbi:MAG: hypothetical protein DRJ42_10145 [Deltaproteobacteria bacterium]|nr:MAG: hypothetical protein DRJ42_10145 [Deltaproteobacteria bacterium]
MRNDSANVHPSVLPLPRPTVRERYRTRVAAELGQAFVNSDHGRGLDTELAMLAALTLTERHLRIGGHERSFSSFDAASFLRWLPTEALLPPEVVPPLVEAWLAFVHFLYEEGRLDEVTAARLRRDLMVGEAGLVRTLGARFDAMMTSLDAS